MPLRTLHAGALLVAAAGVFVIYVSVPELFPTVPPGVIVLAAAAALRAAVARRWAIALATLVPAFILIGAFASGQTVDFFGGSGNAGAIAGSLIQLPALAVAVGAGIAALSRRARARDGDRAPAAGRP